MTTYPSHIRNKNLGKSRDITAYRIREKRFQKALKESGYDHKLTYNPEPTPRTKRKRKRDITWYNPPFDSNVKTNLDRKFLRIVDKCFQKKTSTLQDFQQTHSQAKLLMYAKYEIHHIVTQQTRSFQCKCPNTATRHLQL